MFSCDLHMEKSFLVFDDIFLSFNNDIRMNYENSLLLYFSCNIHIFIHIFSQLLISSFFILRRDYLWVNTPQYFQMNFQILWEINHLSMRNVLIKKSLMIVMWFLWSIKYLFYWT
jgi:hypothetical protein